MELWYHGMPGILICGAAPSPPAAAPPSRSLSAWRVAARRGLGRVFDSPDKRAVHCFFGRKLRRDARMTSERASEEEAHVNPERSISRRARKHLYGCEIDLSLLFHTYTWM